MHSGAKSAFVLLAFLGLVLAGSPVHALIGTIDDVPGSTLLLPYFEVDLDHPDGINTLLSINNASATAILAHVVLWSDLSVHVLDFNVYLTGYDVATISLRDLLVNGVAPRSASVGQDPDDTISPHGDFSQDINFASCKGFLPLPNVPAPMLAYVQAALTGKSTDFLGTPQCFGRDLGDRIARGYLTADTVNACTNDFPTSSG